LIVGAGLVAYHHTFSVPFLFDDVPSIVDNPTIRHLWPIWNALSPPAGGLTVSGRPVLNLTLALNYAVSGTGVWSYHATNLAIHLFAGVILFGIVRRTLRFRSGQALIGARSTEEGAGRTVSPLPAPCPLLLGNEAVLVAFVVAVLWTVHPLQTESVTYISQRAESLVSLFYLLTLYCFIRGVGCHTPRDTNPAPSSAASETCHLLSDMFSRSRSSVWFMLSVAACLLGMASKEVMISAPLIVLLYDRTFLANSFSAAWRQRWRFHLALFGTWLLLGWLVVGSASRGGTAGLGSNVVWWAYALTQCRAVVTYLWLSVWPSPLSFDYGFATATNIVDVGGQVAILAGLLVGTAVALRRWPVIGFFGASFFAVLAPSSSVMPVATQIMAEHRMYLALALVVAPLVASLHLWLGRQAIFVSVLWAACLVWLTVQRNAVYESELALWQDSVAKCPGSARAQNNLGKALYDLGRTEEARAHIAESLRLGPPLAAARFNLGLILAGRGEREEARLHYENAVRLDPTYAEVQLNLGVALLETDRVAEALPHLEAAVRLKPDLPETHCNLGNALARSGRLADAMTRYEEALRLRPDYAVAHYNFGNALMSLNRDTEAIAQYQEAIRLRPDNPDAHHNLGVAFRKLGRLQQSREEFERAASLRSGQARDRSSD
jgi:tetratricopeptide (TPR) repeat protein